eukprot:457325-Rhodomonas_salina.1
MVLPASALRTSVCTARAGLPPHLSPSGSPTRSRTRLRLQAQAPSRPARADAEVARDVVVTKAVTGGSNQQLACCLRQDS